MVRVSPHLGLVRSHLNTLFYAWPTFIGMMAAAKAFPPVLLVIRASVAMLAIALAVYVYNDISDVELDRISAAGGNPRHENRPLVTGRASMSDAKVLVVVLTVIGLGLGFLVNVQFVFLLSLFLMLGIVYSTPPVHLKERFLLKQLTIASGQAIASLAGGAAVGMISKPVVYAAVLFFTLTFGVVPINDLSDIRADRQVGRKTMPIVIGPKTTIKIAMAVVTSALLVSVLSYGWLGFNFAFPVLVGISSLLLLFSLMKISRNWNDPAYIEMIKKRVLWPVSIILQLSILVGLIS